MNDGRVDALGRLWAGTIAVADDGGPVPGGGALYRLDPDLDGDDSPHRRDALQRHGLEPRRADLLLRGLGERRHRRPRLRPRRGHARAAAARRRDRPAQRASPTACASTPPGRCGRPYGGRARSAATRPDGVLDRAIRLPVTQPTSCTFAGDVLVITTAWHRLSAQRTRARAARRRPLRMLRRACAAVPSTASAGDRSRASGISDAWRATKWGSTTPTPSTAESTSWST